MGWARDHSDDDDGGDGDEDNDEAGDNNDDDGDAMLGYLQFVPLWCLRWQVGLAVSMMALYLHEYHQARKSLRLISVLPGIDWLLVILVCVERLA